MGNRGPANIYPYLRTRVLQLDEEEGIVLYTDIAAPKKIGAATIGAAGCSLARIRTPAMHATQRLLWSSSPFLNCAVHFIYMTRDYYLILCNKQTPLNDKNIWNIKLKMISRCLPLVAYPD